MDLFSFQFSFPHYLHCSFGTAEARNSIFAYHAQAHGRTSVVGRSKRARLRNHHYASYFPNTRPCIYGYSYFPCECPNLGGYTLPGCILYAHGTQVFSLPQLLIPPPLEKFRQRDPRQTSLTSSKRGSPLVPWLRQQRELALQRPSSVQTIRRISGCGKAKRSNSRSGHDLAIILEFHLYPR